MADLLIPLALREKHRRGLARYLATGQSTILGQRLEMSAMKSDGSEFPVELSITRLNYTDPPLFTGYIHDITERKRAEEDKTRLQHILESSLNEIYVFDAETLRFEYVNEGAQRNLGYSHEQLLGMTPLDLKREFTEAKFREMIAPMLRREKETHTFETTHRRGDGSFYPIEVHLQFVAYGDRRLMIAIILDITDRKQNEQRIQSNLDRMRLLHDAESTMASTLELRELLNNILDNIDAVLGYAAITLRLVDPETGEMQRIACRRIDERDWQARVSKAGLSLGNQALLQRQPVIALNAQTDPRTGDREFLRKYGFITYIGIPLIAKEKTLGVLSFYAKEERAISDEELDFLNALAGQMALAIYNSRLYEALRKREAELEAANKVKDEFLGMMSHELRTPINVILGYAGLLEEQQFGPLLEPQTMTLRKTKRQSSELLRMVNDILDVTQIEAKKAAVHAEYIKVEDLFAELKTLYDGPLAKNLNFVWNPSPSPPVIVTDGKKLRHILQNLINNAIKFTETGTVTVSCRRVSNWRIVRFEVADTGVGISEANVPAIFDMFHQASSSENKFYGGVGLGLYIVKKFTETLGGTVEVKSELGKGSTFTVTLPASNSNHPN